MTRKPPKPKPPAGLSEEARDLWVKTLAEYSFDDAASLALLRQLCEALDGIRVCQHRIRADGLMITGASGQLRPHPLLTVEAEYRRSLLACTRALRLGTAPEF